MKTRLLGIALLSGVLAINGCSSGNDSGEDGSVIGLPADGDADGSDSESAVDGQVEAENLEEILAIGIIEGSVDEADDASNVFIDQQLRTTVDTLSANGQTIVTAHVVDQTNSNQFATSENTVLFSSECADLGLATLTESVTSSNGQFFASYVDSGCGSRGTDLITATLALAEGTQPTATTTLTVASADPGSIQSESTDNPVLSIRNFGSSSRPETTRVRFRVIDKQELPIKGLIVSFSLTNTTGGTFLVSDMAESDSDGFASAILVAGKVNTTVAVVATVVNDAGQELSTTSDQISISTGLPDQNSFSIATADPAPWSADWDGTDVEITFRGADAYNNPVRDGTIVNFRTEAGSIESTCTTTGGACSVTWVSQNPRPIDIRTDARSVITAYTEGEEYLQADLNANGLMDEGEPFESLSEVFEDFNSDSNYSTTPGTNGYDEYVDFNENGSYDLAGGQFFKGLRCSEAAIAAGHCAETVQVRDNLDLCISGGTPVIEITSTGVNTFTYRVTDGFTNGLPSGTTLSVSAENADVFGTLEITPTLGPLGSCNEGFTDTITIVPDPEATEAPSVTIDVTAGQSGQARSLTIPFSL